MRRKIIIPAVIIIAGMVMTISLWRLGLLELPFFGLSIEEHKHGEVEEHGHTGKKAMVEHAGRAEHDEEDVVRLSDEEINEFGVDIGTAGPGKLTVKVDLPGEVKPNQDRLGHIVPRVSGVVREVRKKLGDRVRTGEVMVVLSSRELADAKSSYLAARERVDLAQANFLRVEKLWKRKITAEKEYLKSKQELAEARIELRSAEQKLHALGFSDEYIASLPKHPDISFTRYEVTAPFDGTVIKKHISIGEAVKEDSQLFVIADLSSVWVDLSVYQKDLPFVREGQKVVISAGHGIPDAEGRISYVGPVVGEETRTAIARVVLPNTGGRWRPGLFVRGSIAVDDIPAKVFVPVTALQTVKGQTSVFVEVEKGLFKPRPVVTGQANKTDIEIIKGLEPGERFVVKGAFTLKSQLSKSEFGEGHAH